MGELHERYSGILVHPTSFPSPYGIGDFGKGAYDFIDFLVGAGQRLWQILPLGPTGYGDSPYQAFSAFAGQPLLISPDKLVQDGLLPGEALTSYPEFDPNHIYYGSVIPAKMRLLKQSYAWFLEHASLSLLKEYESFCIEEADWLEDYALFMAGKDAHGGKCWLEWEDELRDPDEEIKVLWKRKLFDSYDFYRYIQFLFFRQWRELKDYANLNHVQIVGDIPIFVSMDSADVWANRELFLLDSEGYPTVVAGVPPDYFSETGQLWGNPLYDWDYQETTGYAWWMKRLRGQLRLFDHLRIDHFRGFEQYYAIPYGATTAIGGEWRPGPCEKLFLKMQETFGEELPIWAEDLGIITPAVEKLRDRFHFPGMKVLQFAFADPHDNDLLPYRFSSSNCICYTGTHDNDTAWGWYLHLEPKLQDRLRRYLWTDASVMHLELIRLAMSTTAKYAIFPIQDALGFGSDCRMNTPSTPSGNWAFRYRREHLTPQLAETLRSFTELFGRLAPQEPNASEAPETLTEPLCEDTKASEDALKGSQPAPVMDECSGSAETEKGVVSV